MSAIVILLIGVVLLVLGYIFYGSWLAKKWGVGTKESTPAHDLNDGVDYVPAKTPVLLGHHFSSIAGAGPINGPIQAAVFGWVPVFLWIVIGGIFFGAMHDFGSLFASIRHDGKSIAEVIRVNIGKKAHTLFLIFALLVLLLVIASFTAVVSGTFASTADSFFTTGDAVSNTAATATISVLFIVLAVFFGYFVYKKGAKVSIATVIGIIGIVVITVIGLNLGINMSKTAWVWFIAVYIAAASLLPVWILLQPRDYLSSFLLYGMMALALLGIAGSGFSVDLPAFYGFRGMSGTSYLFPVLFITVACGAISGFHSLVSSGTSSKQLDREKDAKIIGYGSMIIECVLALIALLSVGVVWKQIEAGTLAVSSPAIVFATGIATMVEKLFGSASYNVVYALITLAVSVFALTSLDTGTRLGRFMFSELFLKEGEVSYKDASGVRRILAHPVFATLFMVSIGCYLGGMGLTAIWSLFGAANQLLAGIALLAVAAWLGNIGKDNRMFYIPMVFMIVATVTSLVITIVTEIGNITAGGANWTNWFKFLFAATLVILAIFLVIEGVKTLKAQLEKGKVKAEG